MLPIAAAELNPRKITRNWTFVNMRHFSLSRSLPFRLHVFESLAPRNDGYRNFRSTSFAIDSIVRRYFTWSQQKRRKARRFSSNYVYTVEHLIIYCVRNDPKANVYINSIASIAIRFVFISILMRHHIDVRQSTIPISLSSSIYNFCHIVSNDRDDEEASGTSKWIGRFCLMTKWLSFITFVCVCASAEMDKRFIRRSIWCDVSRWRREWMRIMFDWQIN